MTKLRSRKARKEAHQAILEAVVHGLFETDMINNSEVALNRAHGMAEGFIKVLRRLGYRINKIPKSSEGR